MPDVPPVTSTRHPRKSNVTRIGHGTARAFQAAGADVVITGTRAGVAEYDTDLEGFEFHQLDVRDRDDLPTGTYFADWALPEARQSTTAPAIRAIPAPPRMHASAAAGTMKRGSPA